MNLSKSTANVLTAIILVFSLFNCSVQDEDPFDPCASKKLPQQYELDVQAYTYEPEEFCDSDSLYWSDNASYIFCKGSVQKFYCNGTPSGKFDFDITYYPDPLTTAKMPLGQLYQFKFDNEDDVIQIIYDLKAFFSDGKIYKTQSITVGYYYGGIQYDYINGKHYTVVMSPDYTWTPAN